MLSNEMYESFLEEKEQELYETCLFMSEKDELLIDDESVEEDTFNLDARPDSIFPCLTDEDAQAALRNLLTAPKIHVEVAGGILRHDIR